MLEIFADWHKNVKNFVHANKRFTSLQSSQHYHISLEVYIHVH